MFSFGRPDVPCFGGIGAMIDRPGLSLTVAPADSVTTTGPMAESAAEYAHRYFDAVQPRNLAGCRITIERAPRPHVGLGSGTQLALSVAAGLHTLTHDEPPRLGELVEIVGRAKRSSIGTHGFFHGGLLLDEGKLDDAPAEVRRYRMPDAWRFVLLCPSDSVGLSGEAERKAFAALPPVPLETTAELRRLATAELVPAAEAGDFARFAVALDAYGQLAGECFATQQQGRYACAVSLELMQLARRRGARATLQSSWGPMVAALVEDAASAEQFADEVRRDDRSRLLEITMAAPANTGARMERI
jgi:beta-RFAP synthase